MKYCFRLFILAATLGCASARGQALLSFSTNASGSLTLTLGQPVSYSITAASMAGPIFFFEGVGNQFDNSGPQGVSGNITFSINGGPASNIAVLNELNANAGTYNPTSPYLYNGAAFTLNVGDTVLLNAGTLTTANPYTGTVPAGGSFTTLVGDSGGNQLSGNGLAVPEPSTWAATLGGLGLLVCGRRLRRTQTA